MIHLIVKQQHRIVLFCSFITSAAGGASQFVQQLEEQPVHSPSFVAQLCFIWGSFFLFVGPIGPAVSFTSVWCLLSALLDNTMFALVKKAPVVREHCHSFIAHLAFVQQPEEKPA